MILGWNLVDSAMFVASFKASTLPVMSDACSFILKENVEKLNGTIEVESELQRAKKLPWRSLVAKLLIFSVAIRALRRKFVYWILPVCAPSEEENSYLQMCHYIYLMNHCGSHL